jgi:hypothetical protein
LATLGTSDTVFAWLQVYSRSSLGTDGLGIGKAASLATPWGHQTQSLLGSRYRSSLGIDGLGKERQLHWLLFAWLQV